MITSSLARRIVPLFAIVATSGTGCGDSSPDSRAGGSGGYPGAGGFVASGGAPAGTGGLGAGGAFTTSGGAGGAQPGSSGGSSGAAAPSGADAAASDDAGPADASLGSPDAAPDRDAGSDASDAGGGPRPTPPCGTNLEVDNGRVTPELGVLPGPAAWSGGDPSNDGALAVTPLVTTVPIAASTLHAAGQTITVTAATLNATAYVPAGSGPFPLVVVLPGFTQSYTAYATFSQHLASHGFAALGVDTLGGTTVAVHDQEAYQVVQTLDWVLAGKSPFGASIDATKIAVAGHSKGGKIAFYAAALDPRIDLVIGWDPSNSGGGPCAFDPNCNAFPVAPNCNVNSSGLESFQHAETLIVGAPPDPLWNPDEAANSKNFYRGAPSPAAFVDLNTSHASWAAVTANADVVRITKYVHLSRLLQRFRNVTGLDAYLPGGATLAAEPLLLDVHEK